MTADTNASFHLSLDLEDLNEINAYHRIQIHTLGTSTARPSTVTTLSCVHYELRPLRLTTSRLGEKTLEVHAPRISCCTAWISTKVDVKKMFIIKNITGSSANPLFSHIRHEKSENILEYKKIYDLQDNSLKTTDIRICPLARLHPVRSVS